MVQEIFHRKGAKNMSSAPVRIAFLTSIRDIGADDKVGQIVQTDAGPKYMEGVIERTIRETQSGGQLAGLIEVALIITDDRGKDIQPSGYSALPPVIGEPCGKWIFPHCMPCNSLGMPARLLVHNEPSEFRSIPKSDPCRADSKREFERKVFELMRRGDADVLISDHYMAKIEFLFEAEFGMSGRLLNIHPAVTKQGSPFCCRGATPTADVLARAKSGMMTRTGATLHHLNEEFDDGPIVHWSASTPVFSWDTPETLRYRNYQMAKLPVFIRGMRKYATEIYPTL